jgi:hypothetical protein
MHIDKTPQGVPCVTLNGRVFEISRWGAEEQTDTLFDLIGILGDAAGGLADLYKNTSDPDADIADDVMSRLVGKLTTGLTKDRQASKRLLMKLASGDRVVCDGVPVRSYNTFYENDLFLAFQVAAANVKIQYGNFFAAAGTLLGPQKAPPHQAMPA